MVEKDNKRKYPRIPVTFEIKCNEGKKPLKLVTKNLSQGGLLVDTTRVFPLEAELTLEFQLPYAYGEIQVKGKVARHQQEEVLGTVNGMAIEFLDLTDAGKTMIENYIENTQEKDSSSN